MKNKSCVDREMVKKTETFDKLYFCFFIVLPFVYFDKLVDPVLIPRQILLTVFLFLLGLTISYKIYKKKLIADFSFLKLHVFIALGLFLAFTLFSFSQSIAQSESIYVFSKLAIEALFFIATTYLLIQNQLSITILTKAILVFCVIVLIQSAFQAVKLSLHYTDFFDNMLNVTATFGHKNLLASILFLTLPFILALTEKNKWWKIAGYISVIFIFLMAWLLQSKAILIALVIFAAIFIFFLFKTRNSKIYNRVTRITILTATLLVVLFTAFTILNKEKFPRIFDKRSSFERLGLWENSKNMIKDNMVLGVGAGNWQVHFPKYGMDKFSESEVKNGITTFQRPHNDFLWIFCEMGLGGFICYITIFILIIYYLFQLLKKSRVAEKTFLYPAFFAAICCYLFIAFIDFPLERIEHQVLLLLLFSIITSRYYIFFKQPTNAKKIMKPVYIWIFFLVPVLFSFVVSSKRWKGEYHTQRLYFFEREGNWKQMSREAKMAINTCYTMDPMSAPIEWYNGVALFSSGDVTQAKISFEKAFALHPYNMHVINNLASCCESAGNHKEAEMLYLQALKISSVFEEARLNLSAVYYNKMEYEKAFEIIDKCDVDSKDPKYHSFLPAILSSWIQNLLIVEKDALVVQKLAAIKGTNEDLVRLYEESKKKGIDFKSYLVRSSNK